MFRLLEDACKVRAHPHPSLQPLDHIHMPPPLRQFHPHLQLYNHTTCRNSQNISSSSPLRELCRFKQHNGCPHVLNLGMYIKLDTVYFWCFLADASCICALGQRVRQQGGRALLLRASQVPSPRLRRNLCVWFLFRWDRMLIM